MLIIVMLISIILGLFIAGMRSGQYDDTYSPSARVLFEDKPASGPSEGISKKIT
jgi:cbb3-type cytochrome oxidase maturation protein